jgi:peptidylprolyl isomerase
MKNTVFALALALSSLCAEEQPKAVEQTPAQVDIQKISEAFGHLIGKNIESLGLKVDIAQVIKGLQDATAGISSPMTEMECVQAITTAQEAAFKEQATQNLKKAEEFLTTNAVKQGIIVLEPGKLQYKIDKAGTGVKVEEHDSPLIRYTGKFLDGTVFGSTKEDDLISLDETIPGFSKGLLGMKEGEKRTLYIHPDLGYGTAGYLPPNSLLTFEVEIVKANATPAAPSDALSTTHPTAEPNPEVASPLQEAKAVR